MSIFNNGHVKWSWCKIVDTSQIPAKSDSFMESSTSRHQWTPHRNVPTVTDHDYVTAPSPSHDEASRYKQCILRNKIVHGQRNSQYRRENKPSLKRRTIHTNLTTEQIIALEEVFQKKPHVTVEESLCLAKRLQTDVNTIEKWFKNRRHSTNRIEEHYCKSDSPLSDESPNSNLELALIELQIKENTDINGYVTLDDFLINNLVSVIGECLSKKIYNQRSSTPSNELMCYEPISPVTLSENSEDMAPWQNLDPEENLQRLMDIQAFISSQYK